MYVKADTTALRCGESCVLFSTGERESPRPKAVASVPQLPFHPSSFILHPSHEPATFLRPF